MIEFWVILLTMVIAWLLHKFLELRNLVAYFNSKSTEIFRRLAALEEQTQQLRKELRQRVAESAPSVIPKVAAAPQPAASPPVAQPAAAPTGSQFGHRRPNRLACPLCLLHLASRRQNRLFL